MRSSPTRTFSPSDLCLEAGCIVHQQASPMGGRSLRMMAAQNSLPKVFPVLSLPSLVPQILLLLPPMLPQFPLPALRPSAYDSPMLAQVSPSKFIHSHPDTLCLKVLITPRAFPCLPHNSVDMHPNFLPVLSCPYHTLPLQLLHLLHPPAVPRRRPACRSWSGK